VHNTDRRPPYLILKPENYIQKRNKEGTLITTSFLLNVILAATPLLRAEKEE